MYNRTAHKCSSMIVKGISSESVIVRRFSGMACSRSGDLGGFWTMISGSTDFGGSSLEAGIGLLRVFSFPLFLVGMLFDFDSQPVRGLWMAAHFFTFTVCS